MIVVGMSGGVDSSVAALLLHEAGHPCVGVSLQLWDVRRTGTPSGCCSPDDLFDARLVADDLGIPYYVLDEEADFEEAVVEPFVREYLAGRTPSPCVHCNDRVKFRKLFDTALAAGATAVATGHYARVEDDGGRMVLRRGRDRSKDQSYFLWGLGQNDLRRVVLPLGDLTKEEVRAHAERAGLGVAGKEESQDICFVGRGDYAAFVEDYADERGLEAAAGGEIVRAGSGEVLARHDGLHRFTVGQRKGLGTGGGHGRLYVVRVEPGRGRVVVGDEDDLGVEAVELAGCNWVSVAPPGRPIEAEVQVRYRHPGSRATIEPLDEDRARVRFAEPVRAPAPGQAAVFYDERGRVLGGGWIQ